MTALLPDRELAALRAMITVSQPDLLADLEHLVNLDSGELHPRRGEPGRRLGGRSPCAARRRRDAACRPGRPAWRHGRGSLHGRAGRSACAVDRAHGHRLPGRDGGGAPLPPRGRRRDRARGDRHEGWAAHPGLRARGSPGAGRAPVRAADRHRQPGRGDRLARVDASRAAGRGRLRRGVRARVRPRERRHRLRAQRHGGLRGDDHGSRGSRGGGAGKGAQRDPRGGAPGRGPACPERPLAGRDLQRRRDHGRDPPQRGGRAGRPGGGPSGGGRRGDGGRDRRAARACRHSGSSRVSS